MKSKLMLVGLMGVYVLLFQACSGLIFEQNTASTPEKTQSFESQLSNAQQGFSLQTDSKVYETNRIFSNDFPVTYRAKSKKTF